MQEPFKIRTRHHERGGIDTWVKAHSVSLLKLFIQEKMHVVFHVVDKSKRRDRTRRNTQILHQSLLRGEAQLALVQLLLDVVDIHVLVAVEADQIVLVALVVAEEEVFAVLRVVSGPVLLGNLDSRSGRMLQIFVWNMQFVKKFV